jgi:hypothetical protein
VTPEQRALRSRIGGLTTASRHDPRTYTQPARDAFNSRFLEGIPAELPEPERLRRADAARRAHFARLAFKSARARARGGQPADD